MILSKEISLLQFYLFIICCFFYSMCPELPFACHHFNMPDYMNEVATNQTEITVR